jgi:predicted esterase
MMMLQGPELAPAGKAKQLVLILHGYGANGANLMDWLQLCPTLA